MMTTRPIVSASVPDYLVDRLFHHGRRVERHTIRHAGRKRAPQTVELRVDALAHLERVGRRQAYDGKAERVDPLETQRRRIGLGAKLRAADVAQADQRRRRSPP